jgi:hypothetical protein
MFAKASITLCSTIRAAHMLNLHQVDITRPDSCYHVDWIGVEERRRTWWTIFCYDRFTCATTGWPALIHDHNVSFPLKPFEHIIERYFRSELDFQPQMKLMQTVKRRRRAS